MSIDSIVQQLLVWIASRFRAHYVHRGAIVRDESKNGCHWVSHSDLSIIRWTISITFSWTMFWGRELYLFFIGETFYGLISIIIFRFCTSILKRQKLCFCSFIFNTKHVKISLHNYLFPLLDVFIVRITGRLVFVGLATKSESNMYTPTKPQVNLVTCSLGITKAYIIMRYNRRSKRDLFV